MSEEPLSLRTIRNQAQLIESLNQKIGDLESENENLKEQLKHATRTQEKIDLIKPKSGF